jgi:deoxyribonuclease V
MHIKNIHSWNLTIGKAKKLQVELASEVLHTPILKTPKIVAGTDCSLNLKTNRIFSAVVLFSYPKLEIMETKSANMPITFPYVPGFLSFRECPVLIEAFKKLKNTPDLVFVDGHGVSHPRKLGIASHLGLWLGISTVGCAKSVLVGKYKSLGKYAGSYDYLKDKGKTIALALRTKDNCKPVFISVGHKIDLESALKFTLKCFDGYRIPKPSRIADKLAREISRK